MDLNDLTRVLSDFARKRDWEKFHSPKNLTMALSVEASALMEHFQWLTEEESCDLPREKRVAVEEEMADVMIYLIRLADRLGIDLMDAVERKIESNAARYPVEVVRGSAKKAGDY